MIAVLLTLRCRSLPTIVFVAFLLVSAEAPAFNLCDDKIEAGEPHDAFSNLAFGLIAHVLAEKVCGAPTTPFAPKYLGVVERDGCLPGTAVYEEMTRWIAQAEKLALKISVPDGDSAVALSPEVARARALVTVNELGGCAAAIEAHDAQIPPLEVDSSGPAPPGSRDINR